MTFAVVGVQMRAFGADEHGSAAVDWVALAAGILLVGLMTVYALFSTGIDDVTAAIDEAMSEADCDPRPPVDALPEEHGVCPDPGRVPDFN